MTPALCREAGHGVSGADPRKLIPPLHGALLKNEQDVHLFKRLAFMTRRKENK